MKQGTSKLTPRAAPDERTGRRRRLRRPWRWALLVLVAAAQIALLEGGLAWALAHPSLLPAAFVPTFRHHYRARCWRNLQYEPSRAQYDPELSYVLRPGTWRFATREFDDRFEVNRVGLRDDEASLAAPRIIAIGDSFTMGWGVEQDECFVARLEALRGVRILNAGVPSFGTAREMRLFERLDTSRLETLIVQYCANDYEENRAWSEGGGELEIQSKKAYRSVMVGEVERTRYFFGKHILGLTRALGVRLRSDGEPLPALRSGPGPEDEAKLFLDVLAAGLGTGFESLRVVVLELNANANNDGLFLEALRAEIARGNHVPPVSRLVTVDVSQLLDPGDYYLLDSHMRASGHEVVATALARALAP